MMKVQTLLLVIFVTLIAAVACNVQNEQEDEEADIEEASLNEASTSVSTVATKDPKPIFWRRRRPYSRRRRYARRRSGRRRYARRRSRRRRYARRRSRRRRYARRRSRRRRYARRRSRRRRYTRRRSRRRRFARRRSRRRRFARRRSRRRRFARRRSRRRQTSECDQSIIGAYDKCGRRCQIVNSRRVNCCRVRRDFESMSTQEQKRFVSTYKIISTQQPYKKEYDRLIKMHQNFFRTRIHQKSEFLPWHRWFNLQIENLLRKVDCRVTLAYWDWSLWSHDPWNNKKMWSADHGFGGNGRRSDGCVTTGPFRVGQWTTATGDCLRREFNGNPPDADQVAITLKETSFEKFEVMLRVNIHESMHCFINGTMCSGKSAEAPEFFLHHSFIDKIWDDYQKQSKAKKFAFYSSIHTRMTGVAYGPKLVLDNNNLPGGVRVCYENPTTHMARKIRGYLQKLTLKQLEELERLAFSRGPESAKRLFHLSERERRLAKYLEDEAMKGVDSKRKSSIFARTLSSIERIEGFKFAKTSQSGRAYGDATEEE